MENRRNGNLSVVNMKSEIRKDVTKLKSQNFGSRTNRQVKDGEKFLEMISKSPYTSCKTVSQLKEKIRTERDNLKSCLNDLKKYENGYQISIFESYEEISTQKIERADIERERIVKEVRWLHKCLGMCLNRDYFA